MRLFLLLSLAVNLSACAKSESGSTSTPTKSLFSQWVRTDGTLTIDLSGGALGVWYSYDFTASSGEVCSCDVYGTGTASSGQYAITNCAYTGGGSGDPGCAGIDGNGTYSITGSSMRMCNAAGTCKDYQ